MDQWTLHAAFARHAAGAHQRKCVIERGLIPGCPGFQNRLRHIHDVRRQDPAANRILGDKLEQCRVLEVLGTFELYMLVHEVRMVLQMRAQGLYVARIEQVDRAPE
jgi:hypothetical protein